MHQIQIHFLPPPASALPVFSHVSLHSGQLSGSPPPETISSLAAVWSLSLPPTLTARTPPFLLPGHARNCSMLCPIFTVHSFFSPFWIPTCNILPCDRVFPPAICKRSCLGAIKRHPEMRETGDPKKELEDLERREQCSATKGKVHNACICLVPAVRVSASSAASVTTQKLRLS
jgi:hypothetical protein